MHYPLPLLKLIELLKRFPGVGTKSAERFAFEMLSWNPELLSDMGQVIGSLRNQVTECKQCGCLNKEGACPYCDNSKREKGILCVVATPRDVFSVEKTGEYRGLYHVLGGLLSPIDDRNPDCLHLPALLQRIHELQVQELLIALDSTLEGDATALYLKQELQPYSVKISRLAFGIPMGSSLDYIDGDTLAKALSGRRQF